VVQLRRTPVPGDLEVSTNLLILTETAPWATFNILNLGEAPFSWTISSDDQAVSCVPESDSRPTMVTVTATGFGEDVTATLTVTNLDKPADTETVVVQIRHTPVPGNLDVSANLVTLTEAAPSATVNVLNRGEAPITWDAACDHPKVTAEPAWGTDEGEVTISATDFDEDLTANVTIENVASSADREVIVVQVQRTPVPGDLDVSTNVLVLAESAPFATFNVVNLGNLPFCWSITCDSAVVLFDPQAGEGPATVTVYAETFAEDVTATLTVANDDNPTDTESVIVRVQRIPLPANLSVTATRITLSENGPSGTFEVTNRGDLPLQWEVISDHPAVVAEPQWGNGRGTVTVRATDFSQDVTANVTVVNSFNSEDSDTVVVRVIRRQSLPFNCNPAADASTTKSREASVADMILLGAVVGLVFIKRRKRK